MRKRLMFSLGASFFVALALHAQDLPAVQNASGRRLLVGSENTYPTLRVILPGRPDSDKTIEVIFPEHVTVRQPGETEGRHLFLFQPGQQGKTDPLGGRLASHSNMKRISLAISTC
jgi:hypothetical protein